MGLFGRSANGILGYKGSGTDRWTRHVVGWRNVLIHRRSVCLGPGDETGGKSTGAEKWKKYTPGARGGPNQDD